MITQWSWSKCEECQIDDHINSDQFGKDSVDQETIQYRSLMLCQGTLQALETSIMLSVLMILTVLSTSYEWIFFTVQV
ncbi:hypothetical protein CapIbe_005828 [Capra ibex]